MRLRRSTHRPGSPQKPLLQVLGARGRGSQELRRVAAGFRGLTVAVVCAGLLCAQREERELRLVAGFVAAKTGARIGYEDPKWSTPPGPALPLRALADFRIGPSTPPEEALNAVIARYESLGGSGKFQLLRAGQGWSVAPVEGSPLDARITLPVQPRTFRETVVAILAEVRRATGVQIESMANAMPMAWANRQQSVGAENEVARDVLMKFQPPSAGASQLLWSLRYSPGGGYRLEWGVAVASTLVSQDAK